MGLDMYIERHTHGYGKNFSKNIDDIKFDEWGVSNGKTLIEDVAYWRKANAIHGWFVNNIQDGNDDCRDYYLSLEKIKELLGVCKNVVKLLKGKKLVIPDDDWDKICKYEDERKKNCKENNKKYVGSLPKREIVFTAKNLKKCLKDELWKYEFSDLGLDAEDYIKENLEPTDGFFFGSTNLDGGYLYDVVKTILMLENILASVKKDKKEKNYNYEFYYRASW